MYVHDLFILPFLLTLRDMCRNVIGPELCVCLFLISYLFSFVRLARVWSLMRICDYILYTIFSERWKIRKEVVSKNIQSLQ